MRGMRQAVADPLLTLRHVCQAAKLCLLVPRQVSRLASTPTRDIPKTTVYHLACPRREDLRNCASLWCFSYINPTSHEQVLFFLMFCCIYCFVRYS
ncbi:hypothetical protein E2C01_093522 [Portunus trituberculatus]|uniref:Uncharacterized protein n=1 Tax=Portunus trituberculatus TaxID=210409 RepID=A0A5B7JTR8_PORTR|nr:hypothetical protein [Portunus trituberculatus]